MGVANPNIFVHIPSSGEILGAGPCPQPAPSGVSGDVAVDVHQGGIEPCQQLSDTCAFLGSIGWSNILRRDNKSLSLLGLN